MESSSAINGVVNQRYVEKTAKRLIDIVQIFGQKPSISPRKERAIKVYFCDAIKISLPTYTPHKLRAREKSHKKLRP